MKNQKATCDLKSCFLCGHCAHEWLPAVEVNKRNIYFKKNEVIFREGDKMQGMYFVTEGSVKVHKKWGEDKELIVRFAGVGDILGHRGLGNDTLYPVSATALQLVKICFIDLEFFQASLKMNPAFLYKLMMFFAEELKVSERRMRDLAHMPVKGRIALALLSLLEKFGEDSNGNINMVVSRQNLASYAGTTYETAFRVLNNFSENRMIQVDGNLISIKDISRLTEITKDTNSPAVFDSLI
jgi:CRP/FNR family transcriptional regulator